MPLSYDPNTFVKLSELELLTQRTKTETQAIANAAVVTAIKHIDVSGNTVRFFRTDDGTGNPAFTVDFPTELFLDQTRTMFVPSFEFSATTYPGATNPSLEGKPVLVFAVKGTTDRTSGTASDTYSYSFMDMTSLVDVYTTAAGDSTKILTIDGYTITVNISTAADNAIEVKNDGLYVKTAHKADKVVREAAAIVHNPYDEATQPEQYAAFNASYSLAGHVATFDANGNLADSGVGIATSAEVTAMLNEVWGTPASGD